MDYFADLIICGKLGKVNDVHQSQKFKSVLFEVWIKIKDESACIKITAFQSNAENSKYPPFVDMVLNAPKGAYVMVKCKPKPYNGYMNWNISDAFKVFGGNKNTQTSQAPDNYQSEPVQNEVYPGGSSDPPF